MLAIKIGLIGLFIYLSYGCIPTCLVRLFWSRPREFEGEDFILTFDDGPSYVTEELLELLRNSGIRAYFFILAGSLGNIDIREYYKGHMVGLHGYNHINFLTASPARTKREFEMALEVFKSQGIRPLYFRSPYGFYNIYLIYLLKKHGIRILQWDYLLGDWENNEDGTVLCRLRRLARNNQVLVLHDGSQGKAYLGAKDKMLRELGDFLNERDHG